MASNGTKHYRRMGLSGVVSALLIPFIIILVGLIIRHGEGGVGAYLSSPLWALCVLVFFSSCMAYCMLYVDDVILDYLDGSTRKLCLFANRVVAFAVWALAVYAIIKIWLGAAL